MRHTIRFALAALVMLCHFTAGHAITKLINYQAVLNDGSGNPITSPTTVEFRFWDQSAGGVELWMESQVVTPTSDGGIAVLMGSVNPIPDSTFALAEVWLGVTISPDPEMTPRARLVSAPSAFVTQSVNGDFQSSPGMITVTENGAKNPNAGFFTQITAALTQFQDAFGAATKITPTETTISDPAGHLNLSTEQLSRIEDAFGNYNMQTANQTVISDGAGTSHLTTEQLSNISNAFGQYNQQTANESLIADGSGHVNLSSEQYSRISDALGQYNQQKANESLITDGSGHVNLSNEQYSRISDALGNYINNTATGSEISDLSGELMHVSDQTMVQLTNTSGALNLESQLSAVQLQMQDLAAGLTAAMDANSLSFADGLGNQSQSTPSVDEISDAAGNQNFRSAQISQIYDALGSSNIMELTQNKIYDLNNLREAKLQSQSLVFSNIIPAKNGEKAAASVANSREYGRDGVLFTGPTVDSVFSVDTLGNIAGNSISLTSGATAGYVLTADANGVATWQPVAGGSSEWMLSGDDLTTEKRVTIGPSNANTGANGFVAGEFNTNSGTRAVISGGYFNVAEAAAAAIGGGQGNYASAPWSTVAGGRKNRARADYSVVGGGGGPFGADSNSALGYASAILGGVRNLTSGDSSCVVGGTENTASATNAAIVGGHANIAGGDYAAIGGGRFNTASGLSAMVVGGQDNLASGDYSFAAGRRARAEHSGSFVWADGIGVNLNSSAANEFTARATGGARFFSNSALTTGVTLSAGGGAWASVSDRNVKENFEAIDGDEILEKIAALDIERWNYKSQDPSVKHIGPMAQDFYRLFGVGDNNTTITTIDPDGIALAAIKELNSRNVNLQAENQELANQLSEQQQQIDELRRLIETMSSQR